MLTIDVQRAGVSSGQRVLDLGCGGGRHTFACLVAGADVIAVDTGRDEVEKVAATVTAMREAGEITTAASSFAQADALTLPFVDGSFDCVIVAEVLEHLVDDVAALSELTRTLRPGGVLALSVPRAGPERINWALSRQYHETPGGHVRIYRRRELIARVEHAGLRECSRHYAHGIHTPYWWLRCLVGVDNDRNVFVSLYHRVLVWDIMRHPFVTRAADFVLTPLIGKSLVVYFEKSAQ